MKPPISCLRTGVWRCVLAWGALACVLGSTNVWAGAPEARRDAKREWIERPWNIRYFIEVTEEPWKSRKARHASENALPDQDYFFWSEFFEPVATVTAAPSEAFGPQVFDVALIQFDADGFVTTGHSHPGPLRGRLNQSLYLTLSAGDGPKDRIYNLAIWFTGLGDASTHWAPAFCKTNQQPDPVQVRSDRYLYGKSFKASEFSTTFGCREWAYQLYDDSRPYIDVTSYVPKSKTSKGTYIRDFIGWARFGDMKPVIGKHEDTWYCLHDCPNGSKPGAIPDIKAWAASNGWPVPKPPTKAPTFVDPPGRSGTYP